MNCFIFHILTTLVFFGIIRQHVNGKKLSIQQVFTSYSSSYRLEFSSWEQRNRTYRIFQNNLALIAHINSQNLTYTTGINKFAHYVSVSFITIHF